MHRIAAPHGDLQMGTANLGHDRRSAAEVRRLHRTSLFILFNGRSRRLTRGYRGATYPRPSLGCQPFPAMPPYFCRLNQYCIAMEARVGSRRSAAPEARELYFRGASPTANPIAPGKRHARAPSYGPTHSDCLPRPIRTGPFLMEATVDEAEVDDWLIEEILDLLNDALGG
jgi:hypothetical protein